MSNMGQIYMRTNTMMAKTYFIRFVGMAIVVAVFGLNIGIAEAATAGIQLPEKLKQSLKESYPKYRIVRWNEVDETDCTKSDDKSPMVLEGDFNGDQLADFAVLLISTSGRVIPAERDWGPLYKLNLVAFLGGENSSFQAMKLNEMDAHIPIGFEIRLLKKKKIYDLGKESPDGKGFLVVHLKHPGITVERCGGGAVSYYWDGKYFVEIGTGQ